MSSRYHVTPLNVALPYEPVYLEGKVKRISPTYHAAITFKLALLASCLKTMYTFSIEEVLEFSKSYIYAPCIAPDCEAEYLMQVCNDTACLLLRSQQT